MNAEDCDTGKPTPLAYALPWQDFYLSQQIIPQLQLSEIPCRVVWWLDAGDAKKPASSIIRIEEVTAFHRHLFHLEDEVKKVKQSRYRPGVAHRVPGS
jgi:hypothetical protein